MPMAERSQRAETVGGTALARAGQTSGLGLLRGMGGSLVDTENEAASILVAQGLVHEVSIQSKTP